MISTSRRSLAFWTLIRAGARGGPRDRRRQRHWPCYRPCLVGEGMGTVFADVREDLVAAAVPASPRPELAVAWVGDLASRGALRRFVGCRTHFVHSAAAQRHEADHALAVTTETWERMRAVNVDAGFHLARELARPLIAARQPGSFLML